MGTRGISRTVWTGWLGVIVISAGVAILRVRGNALLGLVLTCTTISVWLALASLSRATSARALDRDPVTGLPTQNTLSRAIEVCASREEPRGAIVYLDLDRFDTTNEVLGRDVGDRILVQVAAQLRLCLSAGDVLARVGGDEFAILLADVGDIDSAGMQADTLRRCLESIRIHSAGYVADARVSGGVAMVAGAPNATDVLRRAQAACRTAKMRGRNRVEVYRLALSEQAQHLTDALWSVQITDALRDGRIATVFQPIVDVRDGSIDHFETLARLIAEDGTLVNAEAFIGTAERTGLIRMIDRYVVQATLQQMRSIVGARCAVNLSAISLDRETLEYIVAQIHSSGVAPSRLTFEITETTAIENLPQARDAIETLRSIGCCVALDDFGQGFSSFAHLRDLPVDHLKIDRAFVRNVAYDRVNRALVRAMVELAHTLGIRVVAEGVEDAAALNVVTELGVDLAQGWHVGYPSERMEGTTLVLPETAPSAPAPQGPAQSA